MSQNSIALALAAITFLLSVIWGAPFIRLLRDWHVPNVSLTIRPDQKALTMGGLLFILPVTLLTLLLNFAEMRGLTGLGLSTLLPLAAMLAFTVLGGLMDWRRLRGLVQIGIPDWVTLFGQFIVATIVAFGLYFVLDVPEVFIPFYQGEIHLGFWFFPAAILTIVGMANAFQVSSRVDGLAGLLGATTFAAYGAIGVLQDQIFIARFCFTLVGALFGFLWFNIKPATLHMGRVGTYSMGAAIAVIAMMTGQWPLLLIIAIVPLVEIGSVAVQRILIYRQSGDQTNQYVPLHAFLIESGWSHTQVVQRFWLINLLFAMIGISLALI